MREILFRGKDINTGAWAEGCLVMTKPKHGDQSFIIPTGCFSTDGKGFFLMEKIEVDPATVGQYTGLKDKNGVKIFEGDIVFRQEHTFWSVERDLSMPKFIVYNQLNSDRDIVFEALFNYGSSPVFSLDGEVLIELVVTGNIHDNPELLEKQS